jgi:putative thioredoxin
MGIDANDANFEKEVLEKSKETPVLVDFWAPWCNPCVTLKPVLEKVSEDYKEKMALVKVNVEDNQKYAGQFNVMSIPAVKLFKNGKVVDEFAGSQPEEKIRQWLDSKL